jgi:hypothetical protein
VDETRQPSGMRHTCQRRISFNSLALSGLFTVRALVFGYVQRGRYGRQQLRDCPA